MHTLVNSTALYFDVDGAQLRIESDGLAAAPTIVALHGGPGFDQGYLRPGVGRLRDLAQLILVDLRGQGRSAKVAAETCTLEQMADDVVALCDQLGLVRPFLLGHSAETGEAFRRLVAPYYAGPDHMDVPTRLFPLSRRSIEVTQHFFTEQARHYDLRHRLSEIDVPALVIAGGHDWVCPPQASRTIAEGMPRAELVVLDGARHFTFSEEPESFHDAVAAYLLERSSRSPTARP